MMMKDENNEPQMTIEMDGELMDEQVQKVSEDELVRQLLLFIKGALCAPGKE